MHKHREQPINGAHLIRPDDQVSGMLVKTGEGTETTIFDYCDPFTEGPGVYVRDCIVPPIPDLKIGWGWIEESEDVLNSIWETLNWEMTLDGSQIDLPAFGTRDRSLILGGGWVILREWNIVLDKPTVGEHTLHYIVRDNQPEAEDTTTDMTYHFTVTEK
jgi:hypothetical protein